MYSESEPGKPEVEERFRHTLNATPHNKLPSSNMNTDVSSTYFEGARFRIWPNIWGPGVGLSEYILRGKSDARS